MISVLILTLNEEANLPTCLAALAWSDDVVVYDSFSADRTVDVARAAGPHVRVVQRRFDDWSTHQNWAVRNIPFKHPWVYYSDADEVVTPELAAEMQAVVSDPRRSEVAYRVRFKNMFMGKWLRHSSLYPTWVMRLFRPEKVRWERLVNPVPIVDGREGRLRHHFLHYSFRKGITEWFRKHNKYSDNEAREAMRVITRDDLDWAGMISPNPVRRRAALKDLSFRLPFREQLIYAYLMLVRGGLFDGPAGWTYCRMRAYYEFLIALKVDELRKPTDAGVTSMSGEAELPAATALPQRRT